MNILIIGLGPHTKRIYLPLIKRHRDEYNLHLAGIVDVESKQPEIELYMKNNIGNLPALFLKVHNNSYSNGYFELDEKQEKQINDFVDDLNIDAVIIASEPTTHLAYLLWAMKKKYHVLTDKPITTRLNVANDEHQAKGIWSDYVKLCEEYSLHPELIVSCQTQRRYHPAYNFIKQQISDCLEKTGTGVTSIHIQHSDGQRRHPQEIISEDYHGYNKGYGKCSHSGYHFFDILGWLLNETIIDKIDKIAIFSNFFRPSDFLTQVNTQTYRKVFSKDISSVFINNLQNFGEVDAFIDINFEKDGHKLLNARLSLLHNGFSQRQSLDQKNDLYKGNGRVRQETVIIHQGPFQSIHYHSYQSKEIMESDNKIGKVGGEFHSEVYVFRNKIMGLPVFENKDFSNQSIGGLNNYSRGHQEIARERCFLEFINAIYDKTKSLKSSLEDHKYGVAFMSGAYASAAKQRKGKSGYVSLDPQNILLCREQ